jgi:hypothetical protein
VCTCCLPEWGRVRSAPEPSIELLDEDPEVTVDDGLGLFDPGYLAVESGPSHAFGVGDEIADAAISPEPMGGA